MVNYNNGKIYKVEPISGGEDGDVYIGSTTKQYLSQRMSNHRSDYKRWKNGTLKTNFTSFILFDKYGVENCQIVLLELANVKTKDELVEKESFYIKTLRCVNKVIPNQTRKEYLEQPHVKERILRYTGEYLKNRTDITNTYKKKYRDNNKEAISNHNKIYRENNKEAISEKRKIYAEKNREAINARTKIYRENKIRKNPKP